MKIFPIKVFGPRKYRHRSNMKRACPLCGSFLELDKRGFHCPEGCDIKHFVSSMDFSDGDVSESEERRQHREEYRENPGKYREKVKQGINGIKKAFFIDRKV